MILENVPNQKWNMGQFWENTKSFIMSDAKHSYGEPRLWDSHNLEGKLFLSLCLRVEGNSELEGFRRLASILQISIVAMNIIRCEKFMLHEWDAKKGKICEMLRFLYKQYKWKYPRLIF